jgi:hypothetical protein
MESMRCSERNLELSLIDERKSVTKDIGNDEAYQMFINIPVIVIKQKNEDCFISYSSSLSYCV